MTREQESESTQPSEEEGRTQPSEEEGRKVNIPLFHQQGRREETLGSWQNKYIQEPMVTPREIICSFCGVATHGHKECLVMYQYIREQADSLAQRRLERYNQLQEWVGYKSPRHRNLFGEGEDLMRESRYLAKTHLSRKPRGKEFQPELG